MWNYTMEGKRISNPNFKNIVVGIPCFNEEKHIASIVEQAKKFGDVIVLDDGSADLTATLAREAGATVFTYEHQGYGSALSKLFTIAKMKDVDALITLDGDEQHNPDEIANFVKVLEDGNVDVVLGNRFMSKGFLGIPTYRKFGINSISKISGVGDAQCGFRAYNRKAIELIKINEIGMGASLEIIRRAKENNLRIKEIPCTISYTDTSHSQNPISHGLTLAETLLWNGIWKRPVLLLGIPLLISFSLGMIFSVWLLVEYSHSRWFSPSLAFLSLGGILLGILLSLVLFLMLIGKRLVGELK